MLLLFLLLLLVLQLLLLLLVDHLLMSTKTKPSGTKGDTKNNDYLVRFSYNIVFCILNICSAIFPYIQFMCPKRNYICLKLTIFVDGQCSAIPNYETS